MAKRKFPSCPKMDYFDYEQWTSACDADRIERMRRWYETAQAGDRKRLRKLELEIVIPWLQRDARPYRVTEMPTYPPFLLTLLS